MSTSEKPGLHRRLLGWIVPRRGRWRWALVRLGVVAVLAVVFRYHVLTWLVAGHNLAWKALTRSSGNNAGDVRILTRLRQPGAHMLLRIGEEASLMQVKDPAMIPALIEIARSDPDPRVRVYAFWGLSNFLDQTVLDLATEALTDRTHTVRLAAVHVFRELGQARHLPLLREALKRESHPVVHIALVEAIEDIPPEPPPVPDGPTVKVAAIQFASRLGEPEKNREGLEALVREAAAGGAKIVVLPETAIHGYLSFDIRTAWQAEGLEVEEGRRGLSPAAVAETVPGPSTQAFAALARELAIYLTVPVLEVDKASGKYYNTLCLVGPEGRLLLHYRKLHPWREAERGWAAQGNRGLQTLDTPYGRLALLICYDIGQEPPRLKALKVDTVLYAIAWVDTPRSPWFDVQLPRVAWKSNFNIIGANWTVPSKPNWVGYGHSCVIDRHGRTLASAAHDVGEEIVYADLPIPSTPAR